MKYYRNKYKQYEKIIVIQQFFLQKRYLFIEKVDYLKTSGTFLQQIQQLKKLLSNKLQR